MAGRSRRNTIGTAFVLTTLAVVVLGGLSAGVVSGRARSSAPDPGGTSPATAPASAQPSGKATASGDPSPSPSATKKASASPSPVADESGASAASLEKAREVTVPILMYHHIAPPQGGDTSYL